MLSFFKIFILWLENAINQSSSKKIIIQVKQASDVQLKKSRAGGSNNRAVTESWSSPRSFPSNVYHYKGILLYYDH